VHARAFHITMTCHTTHTMPYYNTMLIIPCATANIMWAQVPQNMLTYYAQTETKQLSKLCSASHGSATQRRA
jgi:hypothetical protein